MTTNDTYVIHWDNGTDACGTFPWEFDTEAEAEVAGAAWFHDFCIDNDENPDDTEAGYEVALKVDPHPIVKFGARWVCDGPLGRFHARTKGDAQAMLAEQYARWGGHPRVDMPDPPAHRIEGTVDHFDRYIAGDR